jgi:ABC-type glycerol-3-phosphate transport system permease component
VPVLEPAGTAIVEPVHPSLASRARRWLARLATYAFIVIVAGFWLLPTVGLFVESLRDPTDIAA